jgi:glycolate oxidase iron-sulfur subunit
MVHAGEEAPALDLARRVIDAFERAQVDVIVTNAGGCGSNVREYGYQLRDDPQYAERAARFSAKCKDVCEFLEELSPRAARKPLNLRVAYHDSCHLQHAQGVRTQPRAQLSAIPGVEMLNLPEATLCCGSAGIYNLVQPETADALADRKAQHITAARPNVVATGNIGCMLQIAAALERQGQKTPVLHTIQLIDASLRGDMPPGI